MTPATSATTDQQWSRFKDRLRDVSYSTSVAAIIETLQRTATDDCALYVANMAGLALLRMQQEIEQERGEEAA